MALEGLYVATTAPWFSEFKRELLSFPAGKHDDQVDALGLIGQLLDQGHETIRLFRNVPESRQPPAGNRRGREGNALRACETVNVCPRDSANSHCLKNRAAIPADVSSVP